MEQIFTPEMLKKLRDAEDALPKGEFRWLKYRMHSEINADGRWRAYEMAGKPELPGRIIAGKDGDLYIYVKDGIYGLRYRVTPQVKELLGL